MTKTKCSYGCEEFADADSKCGSCGTITFTPVASLPENTITHTFATSEEAWRFMEKCDNEGIDAGYPSLKAPYTVKTLRYSLDLTSDLKETK